MLERRGIKSQKWWTSLAKVALDHALGRTIHFSISSCELLQAELHMLVSLLVLPHTAAAHSQSFSAVLRTGVGLAKLQSRWLQCGGEAVAQLVAGEADAAAPLPACVVKCRHVWHVA